MSKGLVDIEDLKSIAQTIREVGETDEAFSTKEMDEAIRAAGRKQYIKGYNDSTGKDYVPEYGIRWLGNADTSCERLGDAKGLVAQAYRGELGQEYYSDFDNLFPWKDMVLCHIDNEGKELDKTNDYKIDYYGNQVIKIPKFYYKRVKLDKGFEIWICQEKKEGYELHPAFLDADNEVDCIYHSAYNVTLSKVEQVFYINSDPMDELVLLAMGIGDQVKNGEQILLVGSGVSYECIWEKIGDSYVPSGINEGQWKMIEWHSVDEFSPSYDTGDPYAGSSGFLRPTNETSRAKFREKISQKGPGWSLEDLSTISVLQMLYLIEYADTSSYKTLGPGITGMSKYERCIGTWKNPNQLILSKNAPGVNRFSVGDYVFLGDSYNLRNYTEIRSIRIENIVIDNNNYIIDLEPYFTKTPKEESSIAIWHDPISKNNSINIKGLSGCATEDGKTDVAYRGICGFHGKLHRFIDGINIDNTLDATNKKGAEIRYTNRIKNYNQADELTAQIKENKNFNKIGFKTPYTNGVATAVGYDEAAPWILFPSQVDLGNGSTVKDEEYLAGDFYCNFNHYDPAILLFGGGMSVTSSAGIFYFHCYEDLNEASYTNGAHMIYKKKTNTFKEGYEEGYENGFEEGIENVDYLEDEFNEIKTQLNIPDNTPISEYSDIINNTIEEGKDEAYGQGIDKGKKDVMSAYLHASGAPVYLFAGRHWDNNTFYPPSGTFSNLSNAEGIFYYNGVSNLKQRLEDCGLTFDFGKNCQKLYKGFAKALTTEIPYLNTSWIGVNSQGTEDPCELTEAFDGCSNLVLIDGIKLNSKGTQDFGNAFRGCTKLTSCEVKGGKVGRSVDFTACTNLDKKSIKSWMYYLLDLTGQSYQTIKFSKTAVDRAFEGHDYAILVPDEPASFYTNSITDMANMTNDEIIGIILAEKPSLLHENNWISIFSKTNKVLLGQIIVRVEFLGDEGYYQSIMSKSTNGQVIEKTIGSQHGEWIGLVENAKSQNWRVYLDNVLQ